MSAMMIFSQRQVARRNIASPTNLSDVRVAADIMLSAGFG
jgi:hypothetical protein